MLPHEASKVRLRRLGVHDLVEFQLYRTDPLVGLYQGWSVMSDEKALEFLAEVDAAVLLQPGRWSQIAICPAGSNQLAGDIGILISADQLEAEIGFTLSPSHQRQGLGASAVQAAAGLIFSQTPVRRIIAITDARNTRCIRLLERIGMVHKRTSEAVFRGEPCTEHLFSLARPERDA